MSIKTEVASLNPHNRLEIGAMLVVSVLVGSLAYFLDHAGFFALGVVPAITISRFGSIRGVSLKTPILFTLQCAAMAGVIALGFYVLTLNAV